MKTALCGKYEQLVHYDCVHPGMSICGMKTALCGKYEQLVHPGMSICGMKTALCGSMNNWCIMGRIWLMLWSKLEEAD